MLPHSSHFVGAGCIAFLSGVGIAWIFPITLNAAVVLCVFGVLVAVTHPREIALLGCIIACLGLGFVRVAHVPQSAILENTTVDAEVAIIREPQFFLDRQRLVMQLDGNRIVQGDFPLQPRFMIGDQIRLQCTLLPPKASADFAYDRYLARYHITALCDTRGQVSAIVSKNSIQRWVMAFKRHAVNSVQHLLPMPEQAIVLGMVFGVDHQLPQEIGDAFRTTGTSHILVISGSQIVLIVGVCTQLLQRTPLSRRGSMVVIGGLLLSYLVMTGWQSSVLRAALCACCLFFVELCGRASSGLRVLLYAATGMVAVNPYVLLYDAGFQLSFLATAGIIAFASRFEKAFVWLPEVMGLRTAAATSLAAMIFTTPLIAWSFHTFSPISLFANICAVPLSGILTISGFGFSLLASVSESLALVAAPVVYLYAHCFVAIVSWFASLPYASVMLPPL